MSYRDEVLHFFEDKSGWKEKANEDIEKFRKGDARIRVIDKDGNPADNVRISLKQKTHEFRFGANIFMLEQLETDEKNAAYKKRFSDLFNMATLPFYWQDLEPERGKPRYRAEDEKIYRRPALDLCIKFCKENGIEPREHALAYDHFYPQWISELSFDESRDEIEKHFKEIAERYGDKIRTIEVTNEMFWGEKDSRSAFFKEKKTREDFVEWCFKTARKYFNENQLVINEWMGIWEKDSEPSKDYLEYIEKSIEKGAPIDAIGLQYHIFMTREDEVKNSCIYYDPKKLEDMMNIFDSFQKPLQITEITIPAYSNDEKDEEMQAKLIENLYTLWFSHPSVEQIIYWNMVDGYAYVDSKDPDVIKNSQGDMTLGENVYYGGLLRFDMSKKPAYDTLFDLINRRWHSEETVVTDKNGEALFRGFYGDYEISIENGEGISGFTLSSCKNNEFVLKI